MGHSRKSTKSRKAPQAPVSLHVEFYWAASLLLRMPVGDISRRLGDATHRGQGGISLVLMAYGYLLGWERGPYTWFIPDEIMVDT